MLDTFVAEFKLGGWERVAGFATKGFVARTVHVALTSLIMRSGCDIVYQKLYGEGKK